MTRTAFQFTLFSIQVDHKNLRDLHSRFIAAYEKKNEEEMTRISHTFIREAALHSDGEVFMSSGYAFG